MFDERDSARISTCSGMSDESESDVSAVFERSKPAKSVNERSERICSLSEVERVRWVHPPP